MSKYSLEREDVAAAHDEVARERVTKVADPNPWEF